MHKLWLLLILLLSVPSYSADENTERTFELSKFDGGLATKLSDHQIPPDKADIAENVRYHSKLKALTKRSNLNVYGTADATEPITGMHRHYTAGGDKVLIVSHGDEIETGNDTSGAFTKILDLSTTGRRWEFLTWHNIVIGSDGYNRPIKYDGTSASATYLGSLLATNAGSGSGPVTGAYTYKVTCYSSTKEILLNSASNTHTANGNDVSLSMIPICPDAIVGTTTTGRKIYRTESNGSTYKLLSNGTITNNTAVTLTDSDIDGALGATMPAGDETWTVPVARFPLVQNDRLFFGNDPNNNPSRLFWSESGSHDTFDPTQYFDIRTNDGDGITFVKGVLGILTVGKNNTIQKVYIDGADPDTEWSVSDPISYVGCQAPYSAVNTPVGIIYLARTGIYRFNGQYSELISDIVTPEIDDITDSDFENSWGVYHENKYFLAYASSESAATYNDRVLMLDVLADAYAIDLLNINVFTVFNSGDDWGILYAGASDSGKVYAYSDETNEMVHKRQSDFTGLWDDTRYIPTSVGGDSESPVIEISRTETIDELEGTINQMIGTIDRQDLRGFYVSQPVEMAAGTFDKLYWNQTTPIAGGSISFKLRTSATGEKNLLHNDDFDFWDNHLYDTQNTIAPNDWRLTTRAGGTGSLAESETTIVQRGLTSVKLTKPNTGTTLLSRTISATPYVGKTMVFTGYAKSANSVASKVWFEIQDNTDTQTTVMPYANSGNWVASATTNTINATATSVTVRLAVGSEANAVAYFDQVMLIEGATAQNDWSAWSSSFTNSTGSDISGVTANSFLQYQIDMQTTDIRYTPTVFRTGGYNVKLSYDREGTAQSASIPMTWRTGWLDLGLPDRVKSLKRIYAVHEGGLASYTVTVENLEGVTDSFTIDTSTNPTQYKEAFTNGKFIGQYFRVQITSNDEHPLVIKKLVFVFDDEFAGWGL